MRRIILFLLIVIISASCDMKLSEDQRKALREEMNDRKIKKIGEEEIYQEALKQGRKWAEVLKPEINLDSVERQCNCTIRLSKDAEGLSDKEKEIFEAYKFDPAGADNIQKDQEEQYLTYTKPQVAADTLEAVLLIRFEKKEIVKML